MPVVTVNAGSVRHALLLRPGSRYERVGRDSIRTQGRTLCGMPVCHWELTTHDQDTVTCRVCDERMR